LWKRFARPWVAMEKTGKKASCVAVLGTASDVGKSVVAAALCRIFSGMKFTVAPFKAQNMSNNSYVTWDGGEIGRAQAVQAECAGVAPSVDMNPLLLKPSADSRSQMVLHGKVIGETTAKEFRSDRGWLFEKTQESLDRLRESHDIVVIEGAGSCAEVNLKDYDIANFRTALSCGAAVILVADIGRGGVFAQVIGTMNLLSPEERSLVKGIVINRFRGDAALFTDGVEFIERETGVQVIGVIPYFTNIEIDSEDSVALEKSANTAIAIDKNKINIAVLRLPRISNFTDFAALSREPCVNLVYLEKPASLGGFDIVILPGSKCTRDDLEWLRETGWSGIINEYAMGGGHVCGICGGYQMLGRFVDDQHGVEGKPGRTAGLCLLDAETELMPDKRLQKVEGKWLDAGFKVSGYEIHMGVTKAGQGVRRAVKIDTVGGDAHCDGAVSDNGKIWGSYIHGIFDEPLFRRAYLGSVRPDMKSRLNETEAESPQAYKQKQYDMLAEHFRKHLDMEKLMEIVGVTTASAKV